MHAHCGHTCEKCDMVSYCIESGEEAEWRGAVDPEWQEVLQLGMSLWLEGSTWQRKGAQERVDLALGEGTYSRDEDTDCTFYLSLLKTSYTNENNGKF